MTAVKFFLMSILISVTARADLATDLLNASDQNRGGANRGLSWEVFVQTFEDGETANRSFRVKSKGLDAYVEALAPARNKGEVYLFNDRNMWFYKPSLKKPVSISARQKFSGQASNGDIASTNYSRDYAATLEKTVDMGGDKIYVLMLKAKSNSMTYDQIRYWISSKSKLAIKAEFLTLQGDVFKRANFEYKNKIKRDGKAIPFVSQMIIVDAKRAENKSIMTYKNPKNENAPDSIFLVNSLTQ